MAIQTEHDYHTLKPTVLKQTSAFVARYSWLNIIRTSAASSGDGSVKRWTKVPGILLQWHSDVLRQDSIDALSVRTGLRTSADEGTSMTSSPESHDLTTTVIEGCERMRNLSLRGVSSPKYLPGTGPRTHLQRSRQGLSNRRQKRWFRTRLRILPRISPQPP